jgi:DNA-binding FadR family transcriptional regulator
MGTDAAEPTPAVTTTGAKGPVKPKAKRRTRDEIRAQLEAALKVHFDNGGGEPQVQPLAKEIGVNRRIVRELLDEMNVRPMIRKAVGQ